MLSYERYRNYLASDTDESDAGSLSPRRCTKDVDNDVLFALDEQLEELSLRGSCGAESRPDEGGTFTPGADRPVLEQGPGGAAQSNTGFPSRQPTGGRFMFSSHANDNQAGSNNNNNNNEKLQPATGWNPGFPPCGEDGGITPFSMAAHLVKGDENTADSFLGAGVLISADSGLPP
ncbi:unnamed protein product, partial [Dibothriocephalus latus]